MVEGERGEDVEEARRVRVVVGAGKELQRPVRAQHVLSDHVSYDDDLVERRRPGLRRRAVGRSGGWSRDRQQHVHQQPTLGLEQLVLGGQRLDAVHPLPTCGARKTMWNGRGFQ